MNLYQYLFIRICYAFIFLIISNGGGYIVNATSLRAGFLKDTADISRGVSTRLRTSGLHTKPHVVTPPHVVTLEEAEAAVAAVKQRLLDLGYDETHHNIACMANTLQITGHIPGEQSLLELDEVAWKKTTNFLALCREIFGKTQEHTGRWYKLYERISRLKKIEEILQENAELCIRGSVSMPKLQRMHKSRVKYFMQQNGKILDKKIGYKTPTEFDLTKALLEDIKEGCDEYSSEESLEESEESD